MVLSCCPSEPPLSHLLPPVPHFSPACCTHLLQPASSAAQLGHGHFHDEGVLMLVETIRQERIVSVAAGRAHSVALAADGKIFTWGDASKGQLGHAQLAAMMQVGGCSGRHWEELTCFTYS